MRVGTSRQVQGTVRAEAAIPAFQRQEFAPWVGDTEPVLQAVEVFLATIQPTAAQAAFVAQNR